MNASRALTVARLGLHVVDADDITVLELSLGFYAVPTREGRSIAEALVGPCESDVAAAVALARRLVEIAWTSSGLAPAPAGDA